MDEKKEVEENKPQVICTKKGEHEALLFLDSECDWIVRDPEIHSINQRSTGR